MVCAAASWSRAFFALTLCVSCAGAGGESEPSHGGIIAGAGGGIIAGGGAGSASGATSGSAGLSGASLGAAGSGATSAGGAGTAGAAAAGPSTPASQTAIEQLKAWLALDAASRPALSQQAFATVALSKPDAAEAQQRLAADYTAQLKATRASEVGATESSAKAVTAGGVSMKYYRAQRGQKPASGWSLFISMHGGGNTDAATNDSQWKNQIALVDGYEPKGRDLGRPSRADGRMEHVVPRAPGRAVRALDRRSRRLRRRGSQSRLFERLLGGWRRRISNGAAHGGRLGGGGDERRPSERRFAPEPPQYGVCHSRRRRRHGVRSQSQGRGVGGDARRPGRRRRRRLRAPMASPRGPARTGWIWPMPSVFRSCRATPATRSRRRSFGGNPACSRALLLARRRPSGRRRRLRDQRQLLRTNHRSIGGKKSSSASRCASRTRCSI